MVRPNPKVPNALKAVSGNIDLDEIISSSVAAEIKHIVSFSDLRRSVQDEIFNAGRLAQLFKNVQLYTFVTVSQNLCLERNGLGFQSLLQD